MTATTIDRTAGRRRALHLLVALAALVAGGRVDARTVEEVRVAHPALAGAGRTAAAPPGIAEHRKTEPWPALRVDPGMREGEPIYFEVEPVTVPLKGGGPIRLRNLTVLGDFPEYKLALRFGGPRRRFERVATRRIDGELVSIFDAVFPREDLFALGPPPIRFDTITWTLPDTTGFVRLRPSTIPKARVVRINDRVQYSSHVVNIVMPYDGISVFALPGEEIAAEFYRHFTDTYEELAFVPERFYWSPCCGARHQFVYQDIDGIGLGRVDERALYGGTRVLRDWIFYIRGDLQSNFISLHETGHNWGWFLSLFDAAGVPVQGSSECAGLEYDGSSVHSPVFGDRHSFLSHCIYSPLYLEKKGRALRIARARPPLTYHPLTLYAMGLVGADEVPTMHLSATQKAPASLTPGTWVHGELTEVTMDDVVAHYGPRRGPAVPPVWRRAVIVVSPDRLLRERDLRWFNFYAKRISDPDATGIESLGGIPSIELATDGRVDVQTEIRPRAHPRVAGDFAVSYPQLGKRDISGLKLDRKLASRFEAGKGYRISGKVKLPGRHETVDVRIGEKVFSAPVVAKRRFSVEIELDDGDRGRHWMTIGLDSFEKTLARLAPVYVE